MKIMATVINLMYELVQIILFLENYNENIFYLHILFWI